MSSEALYEQYKDALKRGHVASLRGRVDDALLAYAEAARIAPERSTPHSSAGTALLRRKRPGDALRHYEVALTIAPRDETALLGRAQALAAMDRRGEAADAFDTLAEVQAGGGRLADAVDAARRGLELAEGRERRRTLERLIERLRATEPDEPGRLALERALQILEGPAVPGTKAGHKGAAPHAPAARPVLDAAAATSAEAEAAAMASDGVEALPEAPAATADAIEHEAAAHAAPSAVVDAGAVEPAGAALTAAGATEADEAARIESAEPAVDQGAVAAGEELVAAGEPAEEVEPLAAAAPEPALEEASGLPAEPEPPTQLAAVTPARAKRPVPDGASEAELTARAEAAAQAGVPAEALDALLDLAALHERDGRTDAAIDACYAALSVDPDSVALHLTLVELYLQQGWDTMATEKLDLLERLTRLDGDEAALADIASVRAGRG